MVYSSPKLERSRHMGSIKPYNNTHRKVFCFFFSKKKRKLLLQTNFYSSSMVLSILKRVILREVFLGNSSVLSLTLPMNL